MTDFDRLSAALADRYWIERHLGEGRHGDRLPYLTDGNRNAPDLRRQNVW